eukprot:CAMPEP_0180512066 /NCGR_PEP_ID=MMETSP1036_2-20121128/51380_1 /TAXON_ID=632150 /ORGANISM="Azadinium spinosum, Strain 3D9" /LENGTH=154 /DNA_ID=CAMNT_0022523161 /DNA_START=238 /DNA_END=699 /DNA_ORIENTATION=+
MTLVVRAFLASFQAQHYSDWELHLVNSKGGKEVFRQEIAKLTDTRLLNGPSSPTRFTMNTWGYEALNWALEALLHRGGCDYFLFTSADNIYSGYMLETALPQMRAHLDLIGFNFVSNHPRPSRRDPSVLKRHLIMPDAAFQPNHVDLGAVLVSA